MTCVGEICVGEICVGECDGGPETGTEYDDDCLGDGRGSRLSGDMIIASDGDNDCMGRVPIVGMTVCEPVGGGPRDDISGLLAMA